MKKENFLIPGLVFTGTNGAFTGRVEVIGFTPDEKEVIVWLTKRIKIEPVGVIKYREWQEEWNIQSVINAFERGDYFEKTDWPGFPDPQTKPAPVSTNAHNNLSNTFQAAGKKPLSQIQLMADIGAKFQEMGAELILAIGKLPDGNLACTLPGYLHDADAVRILEEMLEIIKSPQKNKHHHGPKTGLH